DRVVELKSGNADLYKYSEDRLTEVIFLISHEKTSKEIASLMNLSVRTIDECRIEVMKKTNSKSAIGVLKYAMQHGIFEDVILKGKYGI
ncbi:MAG: response regulator transcription factor, partial [Bacteroidia bacterium]|nr:response regulator transcription factor [Bacteroidia bacterium]